MSMGPLDQEQEIIGGVRHADGPNEDALAPAPVAPPPPSDCEKDLGDVKDLCDVVHAPEVIHRSHSEGECHSDDLYLSTSLDGLDSLKKESETRLAVVQLPLRRVQSSIEFRMPPKSDKFTRGSKLYGLGTSGRELIPLKAVKELGEEDDLLGLPRGLSRCALSEEPSRWSLEREPEADAKQKRLSRQNPAPAIKRQIVFGDEKMGGDLAEIAFQEELYYSKHGVPPQSSLAHFVTTEMGCKCVIS